MTPSKVFRFANQTRWTITATEHGLAPDVLCTWDLRLCDAGPPPAHCSQDGVVTIDPATGQIDVTFPRPMTGSAVLAPQDAGLTCPPEGQP